MKISNLFNSDDRAVSPVIGVILMVAITVILAAVIGTFVLGLGDSLGENQPTAQLSTSITEDAGDLSLEIEHGGGDSIEANNMRIVVTEVGTENSVDNSSVFATRFSVGDTERATVGNTTTGNPAADIRVRVIHTPSDSVLLDRTIVVDEFGTFSNDLAF